MADSEQLGTWPFDCGNEPKPHVKLLPPCHIVEIFIIISQFWSGTIEVISWRRNSEPLFSPEIFDYLLAVLSPDIEKLSQTEADKFSAFFKKLIMSDLVQFAYIKDAYDIYQVLQQNETPDKQFQRELFCDQSAWRRSGKKVSLVQCAPFSAPCVLSMPDYGIESRIVPNYETGKILVGMIDGYDPFDCWNN